MIKLFLATLLCTGLAVALHIDRSATGFSRLLFSVGAGILSINLILAIVEGRAVARFRLWLKEHRSEIERSGAMWKGSRILPETKLVQFVGIASFVVFTAEFRTRYYILRPNRPVLPALLHTLATFLSGWWSLTGLVYTPLAIFKNLTWAYETTIRELMSKMESPELQDARLRQPRADGSSQPGGATAGTGR